MKQETNLFTSAGQYVTSIMHYYPLSTHTTVRLMASNGIQCAILRCLFIWFSPLLLCRLAVLASSTLPN